MADRKISELTNLNSTDVDDDNDELVIVDASVGQTRAITRKELLKDININGDLTVDTDTLFVNASTNRVGIGTSSPSKALEVTGSSGELLRLSVTADGGTQQSFGISFASGDTNTHPAALIEAKEFDAADSRVDLVFSTRGTNNDVAPTEAMRIDSSGNVGIGTSSPTTALTVDGQVDTSEGLLMPVGAGGLVAALNFTDADDFDTTPSGLGGNNSLGSVPANAPGGGRWAQYKSLASPSQGHQIVGLINGDELYYRRLSGGTWTNYVRIYDTSNTTVDGSGFILEASPIVRVHPDSIDEPNTPVGATLTHPETGVYVLSDVEPLATEGWQVRTPSDFNGNKVVTITEPEYDAATRTLTLRTHDLLWHEGRLVPGDPMDIPDGHFVMLRFHEPETPRPAA